jgi:hypothetical protein
LVGGGGEERDGQFYDAGFKSAIDQVKQVLSDFIGRRIELVSL